jgi:hypothetical protein
MGPPLFQRFTTPTALRRLPQRTDGFERAYLLAALMASSLNLLRPCSALCCWWQVVACVVVTIVVSELLAGAVVTYNRHKNTMRFNGPTIPKIHLSAHLAHS